MTWNIHGGICPGGRYDMARTIALIGRHAPDILALQEVEGRNRTGDDRPFRQLREALGGTVVEAPTLREGDGYYGHLLQSRWPAHDIALTDISYHGREPRSAIAATVETPAGPLRVIAAHFGLSLRERKHQALKVAKLARDSSLPVIVLGDFNDWSPRGAVDRAFLGILPMRTRQRTFPVARPLFTLDRIYCRPRALLQRSWTDPTAREASDHLPVIAEVELPAEAEASPAVGHSAPVLVPV